MAAAVKSVGDSASGGAILVKESLSDHVREGEDVHHGFHVSTLIEGTRARSGSERRVIDQISRAVKGIGCGDVEGVAVGGNTKYDLLRRETGSNPSIDSLDR